jgi:hypothetical protein
MSTPNDLQLLQEHLANGTCPDTELLGRLATDQDLYQEVCRSLAPLARTKGVRTRGEAAQDSLSDKAREHMDLIESGVRRDLGLD